MRSVDKIPNSASKAACEMVIASYRSAILSSTGIAVASARAGNVICGGDWSIDRLIPDAVRAWQTGRVLDVRRPQAIRPWQHVLEPQVGYLILAHRLWEEPSLHGPYNFGPETGEAATVREVVEIARTVYGNAEVHYGDESEGPRESERLALEIAKVRALGICSRISLLDAVSRTMVWYRE